LTEADPRPLVGVSTVVHHDGKVLLVERSKPPWQGLWSLPGGHVEWGETLREAAVREVLEETGVTVAISRLVDAIDVIHRVEDGSIRSHHALTVFLGKLVSGVPQPGSDAAAVMWADPARLTELRLLPGTREAVERALAVGGGQ
jgi:ADP-ribose pyrophosphatase YjhB (NUDIX family)